jgi:hypothetical protein
MLGTYFFIVSSFSLSHTPSSLWIYGKEAKKPKPCPLVTAMGLVKAGRVKQANNGGKVHSASRLYRR